ncbi:MAG: hypothetical protein QOF95_2263, partial [Pseudonocardiales bacterium]|nr:hypothetical protein [Pseudonocardiales bacterium]
MLPRSAETQKITVDLCGPTGSAPASNGMQLTRRKPHSVGGEPGQVGQ